MEIKDLLLENFKNIFGDINKKELFFTPGRVNLIGEHIDFNGGYVFPCALDFGTYALIKKREDNKFRLYSANFPNDGTIEFEANDLIKENIWGDYVKGVVDTFINHGYKIEYGCDMVVYGNIPNGAGLSSSASLEVLTGTILKSINNLDVDMIDIVKMSKEAENKFIGVNCGIMDQFAVGMGVKDKAMLLNCNTLDYEYAPIKLENASIVIMNTNKRRGLADSNYNKRRTSCEVALENLKSQGVDIDYLCDLDVKAFEKISHYIKDEEDKKRATHAVYENARVLDSIKALKENDIEKFGQLMNESHISLRDLYEVTGKELDSIVYAAWEEKGCIGARMTGAGFGGCAVAIVKNDCIDDFIKNISEKYEAATGLKANCYIGNVGDGSRKLGDI